VSYSRAGRSDVKMRVTRRESERKKDEGERLLCRAMNVGMHRAEHRPWRNVQSDRLMEMAQRSKGSVVVLVSDAECEGGEDGERVRVGKVKVRLNYGVLDIAFAAILDQYEPEVCKELEELID